MTISSDLAPTGDDKSGNRQSPAPSTSLQRTNPSAPVRPAPASPSAYRPSQGEGRAVPARPSLTGKDAAPVLVKRAPPFVVGLSQLFWILSLLTGAVGIVYAFVIRRAQLPDIITAIKNVDDTRVEDTYSLAADIVFWSVFGALVVLLLVQLVQLVSFTNRRSNTRWWQFGTLMVAAGVTLVAMTLIGIGQRGQPLTLILLAQLALALLALLLSVLPPALRWTARKHDVRRGPEGPAGDSLL